MACSDDVLIHFSTINRVLKTKTHTHEHVDKVTTHNKTYSLQRVGLNFTLIFFKS